MFFEELNLPNIPRRSRLYQLEPVAIGTPYVEGLISYICRLAEAHCVSPKVLIDKEILPSYRKNYTDGTREIYLVQEDGDTISVSSQPKPAYRKNLNEYGLLAWQYLEGLKPLTLREDLQALIISSEASEVLPKGTTAGLSRELRAWCPDCFSAWSATEQILYEPLLWSISAVTLCPCHYKPLQSRCPQCQRVQRPFTAKTYVARCSQCSGWLGVRTETASAIDFPTTEIERHLEVAKQVMEVLSSSNHLFRND